MAKDNRVIGNLITNENVSANFASDSWFLGDKKSFSCQVKSVGDLTGLVWLEASNNLNDWVKVQSSDDAIGETFYSVSDANGLYYRFALGATSSPIKASGTITGSVGILDFEAVEAGDAGNSIEIALVQGEGSTESHSTVNSIGELSFTSKVSGSVYILVIDPNQPESVENICSYIPTSDSSGQSISGGSPASSILNGGDNKFNIVVDGGTQYEISLTNDGSLDSNEAIALDIASKINTAYGSQVVDCFFDISYGIISRSSGSASSVVVTDASSNNVADDLKLGLANGGIEIEGVEGGIPPQVYVSGPSSLSASEVKSLIEGESSTNALVSVSISTEGDMSFEYLEFTGATSSVDVVASVLGSVVTVSIDSGVSTATQIKDAIEANSEASALVSVTEDTAGAIEAGSVTLSGGDLVDSLVQAWVYVK